MAGGILAGGILSRGDFGWGDIVWGDIVRGDFVQWDFVRGDFVLEGGGGWGEEVFRTPTPILCTSKDLVCYIRKGETSYY